MPDIGRAPVLALLVGVFHTGLYLLRRGSRRPQPGGCLRDTFATDDFKSALQPVIGMETFNAGPRSRIADLKGPVE